MFEKLIPFHNLPSVDAKSSVVADQVDTCRLFWWVRVSTFVSIPGLWVEGRSGEHQGLRKFRTEHERVVLIDSVTTKKHSDQALHEIQVQVREERCRDHWYRRVMRMRQCLLLVLPLCTIS